MNLLFDFTVDKATATIHITREFAADLDLVWDAFTKAEMLDQWMCFKPWGHQTKEMDFREGGRWLHAMISPENVARWSLAEFIKIQPKSGFTTRNSFCDENGDPLNNVFTSSLTETSFKAGAGITTVQITKKMASLAQLEQFVAGGYFKEGTAAGFANLDEYLRTLVTSK
jgi:PhnB protein